MAMLSEATGGYVNVIITNSATSFTSEKRFPLSTTIGQLKGKLELITGIESNTMKLDLLNSQNEFVCSMVDGMATLESYSVHNGMTINVTGIQNVDEDLSKVPKYEMSDEDYAKRGDSVRAFKERMKLGRFSDNEGTDGKKEDISDIIKNIPIGSRCEVTASNAPPKRGVVMFVGNTHFKEGIWVGVKCDEPLGKNDGSIEGKRYFDCQMKYGVFVKPSSVKVGDFPEESISDDEI